jgi:hypothetical protein
MDSFGLTAKNAKGAETEPVVFGLVFVLFAFSAVKMIGRRKVTRAVERDATKV